MTQPLDDITASATVFIGNRKITFQTRKPLTEIEKIEVEAWLGRVVDNVLADDRIHALCNDDPKSTR
jgi:hypothetical protein